METLDARLRHSLGDAYRVDRELGGRRGVASAADSMVALERARLHDRGGRRDEAARSSVALLATFRRPVPGPRHLATEAPTALGRLRGGRDVARERHTPSAAVG